MTSDFRDQLQASLGSAYRLERELGGGGMSRVFTACDAALGRTVVVKVLPPEMAATVSTERFKREIALAARLQHPHVVPLLAAGDAGGLPFFTMPFVEGETLRARIARAGELPIVEAIRVLREVASALDYAHEQGIVHRDVKPDNVLLSRGSAMVTDFGVAKALSASTSGEPGGVTSIGVALGTPAYMAPEQAVAAPDVDARADIYAWGVLAYELLTGRPPFAGRSPQATLSAHVVEAPEPLQKLRPSVPPALATLVMRCLEKRPADRPQSAAEVVHALDALVTPSGGLTPTDALPAARVGTPAGTRPDRAPRLRLAVAGAVVAGAVALALYWSGRDAAAGGPTRGAPAAARSIVVLPFVNVGGDSASAYFAEGMTDEVTAVLARVPGLRVASRSAAAAVAARPGLDPRGIGRQLDVGAVLEGRIRRDGDRMRLYVELTSAENDSSLWRATYEREPRDAFAVQDDIARSIAAALRLELGSPPRAPAAGTRDPEAHDLVLRARYQTRGYTEASVRRAIALFGEAIRRDSTYAAAWSGLADAWYRLADFFVPAREAIPHIRAATARALALDSTLAEAHAIRAYLLSDYERDYRAADRAFVRALRLDSASEAAVGYARNLALRGDADSARAVLRRLRRLDPLNRTMLVEGPWSLILAGAPGEARDLCDRAVEIDSAGLGGCRALLFMVEERWAEMLAACPRDPWGPYLSCRPLALAGLGRVAEARREQEAVDAASASRYVQHYWRALVWARLGDRARALAFLDTAFLDNEANLPFLAVDPAFEPLHGDPRFEAIRRRVAPR